jgi:hypothetical protein
MKRLIGLAALMLFLLGCSHSMDRVSGVSPGHSRRAGPTTPVFLPDEPTNPPGGGGLPSYASEWGGGTNSLPFNNGSSPTQIVAHALVLGSTQLLMSEFDQRGYIRRADKDTAYTYIGVSWAIIAYEKPNVAITQEQPTIFIETTCTYQPSAGGWVPTTMAIAGVMADSCGRLVPRMTGVDAPVAAAAVYDFPLNYMVGPDGLVRDSTVVPPEVDGGPDGPMAWGGFSGKEGGPGTHPVRKQDPEVNAWWIGLCVEANYNANAYIAYGGMLGWVGGPDGACVGAAMGSAFGWMYGAGEYMIHNPYPQ